MVSRKAQGMSLNVIIIAAIALVVMVILITLVLNSASTTNDSVNSCYSIDGAMCQPPGVSCGDGYIRNPARSCPESSEGSVYSCCIPL